MCANSAPSAAPPTMASPWVPAGEPLDRRTGGAADRFGHAAVGFVVVLAQKIQEQLLRRVVDSRGALEARVRGGNEAGGERRRARRRGVALEDEDLRAGILR